MNYCRECGKIIEDDQKYCPYCGKEVNDIFNNIDNQNTKIETMEEEESTITGRSEEESVVETKLLEETPYLSENKIGTNQNLVEVNRQPLSNWIKVSLSILVPALPGIGALIGIIAAIIFMTKEDEDRKTFGYALLTYSVIFLILICTCCMIFAFGLNNMQY